MSFVYQVSQVYQTIEFKRFASLVPFADKFKLERIIVGAAKNMELQVRVVSAAAFNPYLTRSTREKATLCPKGPKRKAL